MGSWHIAISKPDTIMTKIPEIVIGYNGDQTYYGIMGWDDFNRYASNNLSLYRSLVESTRYMTEIDRLHVMLWHYVNEAETAKALYYKAVEKSGVPVIEPVMGPDGQVWRYVGP